MMRVTDGYRVDADWPMPPGVAAFTTTRALQSPHIGCSAAPFDRFNLGAACGDPLTSATANREQLIALAGLPNAPCWLKQTHGVAVARFDSPSTVSPEADASVTDKAGVVLAILTADCLPVLFAASDGSEVGASHAGWRGLCGGVLEATVAAMNAPPSRLQAWLGPAAGPRAHEVGEEVRATFLAHDPRAAQAFEPTRTGHWLCDLYALARQRLAAAGVSAIYGGDFCTISTPTHWYSHRRDGQSGRMASLIYRSA